MNQLKAISVRFGEELGPKREKEKVVSYKENYEFRVREGIYYDET